MGSQDLKLAGSMRWPSVLLLTVSTAILFLSCERESIGPENAGLAVVSIQVAPHPTNAFASLVRLHTRGATTAWAEFSSDSGAVSQTPPVSVSGDSAVFPVLGLRPETSYGMRAVISSSEGETVRGPLAPLIVLTPSVKLPAMTIIRNTAPSPGFIVIGMTSSTPGSAKSCALIIDNEGRPVWHRNFPATVTDFQKQPNGSYSAYSSLSATPSKFFELDNGGTILREIALAPPLLTDAHELRLAGGDDYLLGIDLKTMDLTSLGGAANATVRGITVDRLRGSSVLFHWTTFDHFQVADAASDVSFTAAEVNPWHGNALEIDTDGNFLVSFRNADVIAKINSSNGAVLWRLGGKNNQFIFLNDPLNGFSHQHGIRRLPNGNIILFDNGNLHNPPVSRAVEYALNEVSMTATLVWEYRGSDEYYSSALGFAQRLANGNTLICFGIAQHIVEVTPSGTIVWEVVVTEPGHYPYRAFRIDSLY